MVNGAIGESIVLPRHIYPTFKHLFRDLINELQMYLTQTKFTFLGQTLAPTSGKTVAPPADTSLICKR